MTTRFGKNPSSNWRDKSDLRTILNVYTINLRSPALKLDKKVKQKLSNSYVKKWTK